MATISKYETKSGETLYRVRYRTPGNRQTDKRGFTTKREAELFAAGLEVSKARGEYIPPRLGQVTIGELGTAWLARRQAVMKPSGFKSYETSWRAHVEPRWGATRLSDVRFTAVQAWVGELAERRGSVIVRRAHGILARIVDDAVRDRLLIANPARGVQLPATAQRRNVYLTAAQLRALACQSGRYGSLVLLLGTAGLRWGEAAALTVGDIDFLRRRIDLHRNAVAVGGRIVVGTLKSGEARTVPMPSFVVDELAATCAGKDRDELIWATAAGGYLSPPSGGSWLDRAVTRCRRVDPAFPRVTAHALRHTAASLAVSSGANVKAIQRMLGHRSAAMTLDRYADLFDDDLTAVAERLHESVGKMWARGQ